MSMKKKWGGAREGAGRPSLYPEKKKVLLGITPENLQYLEEEAKKMKISKSDTLNTLLEKIRNK